MKVFLFLDDDIFDIDKIRKPRIYYPLIGANDILEKMNSYEKIEFFTTVEGAIDWIEKNGCPNFISFDNDLKRDLEGRDLAKWLVEKDLDNNGDFIPDDFEYFVHSQNIDAKKAINALLENYLNFKKSENNSNKVNKPKL